MHIKHKLFSLPDIIVFFENNIYSRRSIPESEWVDHLKIFFRFIIDRRTNRANEWFAQNVYKFPNNNEIVLTKYALEAKISKLKSFWDLCCIQCDECGLKCLKSKNHSDSYGDLKHSCLTDHRCHELCDLKESHAEKELPKCINYANHEGIHRCSQKGRFSLKNQILKNSFN